MSDDYDYRECDKLFDSLYPVDYFYHSIYDGRKDAVAAFRACYRKLRPKNVDHEFKELEKRLLGAYSTIFARSLAKNAAAAMRQQAERIEYLEGYIEAQKESFDEIAQGNKELQARLSRWESQKVVAWQYWLAHSKGDKGYSDWRQHLNYIKPSVPDGSVRDIEPLISRLPDDEGGKDV